jgi:hypothetical protein
VPAMSIIAIDCASVGVSPCTALANAIWRPSRHGVQIGSATGAVRCLITMPQYTLGCALPASGPPRPKGTRVGARGGPADCCRTARDCTGRLIGRSSTPPSKKA